MISIRHYIRWALTLLLLCPAVAARADGDSDPRAVAMGGAYTALARGLEAPLWNPANLGLSDPRSFSINLFSAGMRLKNNSFSIDDYNKYNGRLLTDEDKDDIMREIPPEGLHVDMTLEASALNFAVGNLAVTCRALGSSSMNVDRDPFELMLMGNVVKREMRMSNSRSEGYALGDFAFSYGRAVAGWQDGELSFGASIHYMRGLAYGKIIESEGGVVTTDTGFVGSGHAILRTALGGNGYSSDIGMALRFSRAWYFSAVWQNVLNKLIWDSRTEERLFAFEMRPVSVDYISGGDGDSLVTKSDTTYAVRQFTSRLAPALKLGLAKKYRRLTWSVDYEQAFFNGPGKTITPKLSAGFEYCPIPWLPLRAGLTSERSFSTGFGLVAGTYDFGLAIASTGSPAPAQSRGIKFAVGMMLHF